MCVCLCVCVSVCVCVCFSSCARVEDYRSKLLMWSGRGKEREMSLCKIPVRCSEKDTQNTGTGGSLKTCEVRLTYPRMYA